MQEDTVNWNNWPVVCQSHEITLRLYNAVIARILIQSFEARCNKLLNDVTNCRRILQELVDISRYTEIG